MTPIMIPKEFESPEVAAAFALWGQHFHPFTCGGGGGPCSGVDLELLAANPHAFLLGCPEIGLGVYATITSDPRIPEQNDTLNPEYGCRPPYLILHWHTVADDMAIHQPHRLAALCLYGQSFGFSSEEVAAIDALLGCRIATSDLGPEEIIDGSVSSGEFEAVESVLRKIKALLPPEPKT